MKRAAIVLDAFESNNNVDKLNLDNISSQDQAFKVFSLLSHLHTLHKLTPYLLCPHGFTKLFTLPNETRRMLLTSLWSLISVKVISLLSFKTCSLLKP